MSAPVVLVHGLSASTQWWRPTIAALEPDHDVLVVRLPGVRYSDAAEWLANWLRAEGLAGATLVGHSMGGAVALVTAAANQDLVARLALIAPAGVLARRRRRSYVVPLLRSLGGNPARIALAARDVLRVGPFRLWGVATDLLRRDLAPVLRRVQAPTLLVWGENDRVVPPSVAGVFCEELPDSRLVVLRRCGHVPMLEAPEALNAALRAFLDERADERPLARPDSRHPSATVSRRSRYLLSLPERAVRATAALVGGAVHEGAQLLLPRLVRRSRFYEVSAKNLLRILVEGVGAVESGVPAEPQTTAPRELAVRKGAGNVVELGSILAFGFSPLWLLAATSDITRGSRVYLQELVAELKAARVVADDADVGSIDELLAVLEGTSGRTARLVDLPPLELEELRSSLSELRKEAADLPSPEELAQVYEGLRLEAAREDRSLLEVSSGVGLAFLLSARNVSRTHLIAPYSEDWKPVRDEGFAAYARRVGRPYARAVSGHFDPDRVTYTQRFLARNDPGSEARFCDEFEGGFGWQMDERLKRTSHAVAVDGRVWIFDPVAWEPALERMHELGEPVGVVQLLDRHERDSAAVAARFEVPHYAVPPELPGSGVELVRLVDSRFWREVAAWIPSREALVCADALGTVGYFRAAHEPVGVHPLLRLRPPRRLARYAPQHLLCGHGAGIHGTGTPDVLRAALKTARRRLPRALASSFRWG